MRRYHYAFIVFSLASRFVSGLEAAPVAVGVLPMRFEANAGQVSPEVRFLAHGDGYSFFLTSTDAVMAFSNLHNKSKPAVLTMKLLGGNRRSAVEGLEELPGRSNYFQGTDPSGWRTNIPAYAKVRYADVYPGVELVYYGNDKQLEYDFVVAPGASARAIGIRLEGADQMHIDHEGDLVLGVDGEEIRFRRPVAYQKVGNDRRDVAVKYLLQDRQVRFQVGTYNAHEPLVIDPVLSYSTFLGGSGADAANAIATDAAGSVYIAGSTTSLNYPAANAVMPNSPSQTLCAGTRFSPPCSYIFVTKLTADGSAIAYSSFLGGGYGDAATGIAVDAAGNAYVTGNTTSSSLPLVGPVMNQGSPFVLKLSPTGSSLIYSTHFGGSDPRYGDSAAGIAVNSNGEVYVGGTTASPDFPAVNPLPGANCSASVPFVTKFSATGSALQFSTCLPSPGNSVGRAIAVDGSGNVYVTGQLGFDPTHDVDAFVAKLTASGAGVYSNRLGGSLLEIGFGIAADNAGNAYVTGYTGSADFPVMNAFQAALAGGADAFVTKLNPSGAILYSTFLGGTDGSPTTDLADSIAVDNGGRAYIAGVTSSPNFPTANALQAVPGGGSDAFVAALSASGSSLLFSSYLGGSDNDSARGIAVDGAGNVYVTGSTQSANFPTLRALQASYAGRGNDSMATGGDAFVTKIIDAAAVATFPVITSMSPSTATLGSQFTATITGQNMANPSSMSFSGTGVVATVQPGSSSGNVIMATISVAANATPGARSLTIGTSTGIVTMPNALVVVRALVPATAPLAIPDVETGAIRSGYVIITPDPGTAAPLATLTFGIVGGGMVQSQAAILPTALTNDASLQVDVLQASGRNVGLAIANPNDTAAIVTLTLRNEDGTVIGTPSSLSIPAGQQLAKFITELFPSSTLGSAFRGSLRAQSSVPVSLIGLRFSGAEFSTLPVIPANPASVPVRVLFGTQVGGVDAAMFSQFAMSGGWASALGLVNTSSSLISGRVDIFDSAGNPLAVRLNNLTQSTFFYSIPANGTFTLAPRDTNGQSPF